MLTKPNISDVIIIACIHDTFGLDIVHVDFLPLGWVNNAVYRVTADTGIQYFLKLRQGGFSESAVTVPTSLHAQGIQNVMSPLQTNTHALWMHAYGFDWILYPYFEGKTGFEAALSKSQWLTLGATMYAIHTSRIPATVIEHIPIEQYSPRWRDQVKTILKHVAQKSYTDPIAASLALFFRTRHDEIASIIERAERLSYVLQTSGVAATICHSDLHAGNVLVGPNNELTIVDWDEPIIAPKERDLMFIGGGVGGIWNTEQEKHWFYQGYGQAKIDLQALCYYRYERIIVDLAEHAERIFSTHSSIEERMKSLRLRNQFLPNNVVDMAHKSYLILTGEK